MKALVLHDISPDIPLSSALEAAGHEVVRCTTSRREAFPCVGLEGRCPLDGTVDVAVVVHDRPTIDISPGEAGAVCALRDGIPLVVAGNGSQHPFGRAPAAVAVGVEDVVAACDRAVAARAHGLRRAVGTEVRVDGDQVRATLPPGSSDADVLRAHRELSAALPRARIIEIGVAAPV